MAEGLVLLLNPDPQTAPSQPLPFLKGPDRFRVSLPLLSPLCLWLPVPGHCGAD